MITQEVITLTDERYNRHKAAIDFLGRISETAFDLELSNRTLQSWTLANLLIRDVDSIYDSTDEQVKFNTTHQLIELFQNNSDDIFLLNDTTTSLAKNLRSQLSDRQSELFLKRGLQIIELQNELRSITDPKEYSRVVMLEGYLQCSMFINIADPLDRQKPNFVNFEKFFLTGSGLGNLLDSIVDIGVDNQEGQTIISPNLKNRLAMGIEAKDEIKKAIGLLPVKSLASFIGPMIEITKDRNRTPDQ